MSSNYLAVLKTALSGVSGRKTAKQYGVSRDTVAILLKLAKGQGWHNLQDLEKVTEQEIKLLLTGSSEESSRRNKAYEFPDYDYVHQELGKPHVTLKMLWEEYVETCILENKRYYGETQFRRYYHQYAKCQKSTLRLEHKPGFAMQVDWAGTRIGYYDEELGEFQEGHLFVAVLPCSNLIYAEVFRDEKLHSWITAHANCFSYLGGVPKTIIPDNLKTGISKANFYEPVMNRTYQEMADFYGTVILPARVKKPRDKGAVENAVKIASQKILAKLRNERFHSFFELWEAVAKALEKINSAPLTNRKNISRWDAFLSEEKDYLLMLPTESYELSEWKFAKVQPNSHIVYQGNFYSVPFEHLAEMVDVRATHHTVEIFYHHQRIASHKRSWGNNQYLTVKEHMPPGKLFFVDWDRDRFIHWSGKIGVACQKVVINILDRAVIEQQAYRSCFGLLSLKDKYTEKRLEKACQTLLDKQVKAPTYSQVKRILERNEDLQAASDSKSSERPQGFRRGSDYYKK